MDGQQIEDLYFEKRINGPKPTRQIPLQPIKRALKKNALSDGKKHFVRTDTAKFISLCTQAFIENLARRACNVTLKERRHVITVEDVVNAAAESTEFDFLVDVLPPNLLLKAKQPRNAFSGDFVFPVKIAPSDVNAVHSVSGFSVRVDGAGETRTEIDPPAIKFQKCLLNTMLGDRPRGNAPLYPQAPPPQIFAANRNVHGEEDDGQLDPDDEIEFIPDEE